MEVRLLADEFECIKEQNNFLKSYIYRGLEIDILVSGIGTTFTTFHLTNTLHSTKYSLVMNIGIAGSFTHDLKIGQVVNVASEEFADLGIEDQEEFLTLFDSGFLSANEFPFKNGILKNPLAENFLNIFAVRGITSNKSSGRMQGINKLSAKYNAHIESMEGAAVFYVCKWMGVPFLEIRAISNYIEPRDPSKWDIPLALENLQDSTLKVLQTFKIPVA
jgi:futalosine hydrolase